VLTADANIRLRIPQLFGSGSAGLGAVSIRWLKAECRVLTADANIGLRIPQLFGSGSAGLGTAVSDANSGNIK